MTPDGRFHLLPAWLGHGALIPRAHAALFMDAMTELRASAEQFMMADNYFSILSNRLPELWFDHSIELGLGDPFTQGLAGEERNWKHFVSSSPPILSRWLMVDYAKDQARKMLMTCVEKEDCTSQYVNRVLEFPHVSNWAAPCKHDVCVLRSNISILPGWNPSAEITRPFRELISKREGAMDGIRASARSAEPRNMLDGNFETAFQSPSRKWLAQSS
jgi:hypothetical protein